MAGTLSTRFLNGEYNLIENNAAPTRIDWGGDAEVNSTFGILSIMVGVWQADTSHDRLGIILGNGISASNGLNVGSEITIDKVTGVITANSTQHSFGITFKNSTGGMAAVSPIIAQKFIRALTYQNTSGPLQDDFQRKISISLLNDGTATSGNDVHHSFVTFMKWIPEIHGGSTGGLNLPPEITGDIGPKTIADGGRPFSGVSITDPNNDKLTVSVKISDPSKGGFLASSLSGGTYDPLTGIYTVTGTPAQVQDAIRKLVFTQGSGLDSAGSSTAAVSFEIFVTDRLSSDTETMDASFRPNKADKLNGKASSEKLYGHGGKDTIDGKGGSDKIWGGSGNDQLTGGTGKDAFVFDSKPNARTNKDTIADFSVQDDSIWLDNAFFSALGTKGLESSYFVKGSKAKDKNDFIIYDKAKGKLFYDADGSGSKIKAVEIATLSKDLAMTYKDFFVI